MSHRLTDRLADMIRTAFEDPALVQSDDITWDVTLAQQATGPVGLIFVFLPSGVVGETIQTHAVVENPAAAKPTDVVRTIAEMVEALRRARSAHLAKASPSGVLTPGTG